MIKEAINKLVNRISLTAEEAEQVMTEIMSGQATESQIASFITALRMKGETIEEITSFAKIMRQFAVKIDAPKDKIVLDTCGTGGDGSRTFNISTITAFVIAGAGGVIAKHGNRSVSSSCGSADVLEKLGVKLDITKEKAEKCLSEIGIVFLFAPIWHPAMKYAIGPRKQIGIRTVFNILGPLCNPVNVKCQILGVYREDLIEPICQALKNLGLLRAMVIHSKDSLDEISISSETIIAELSSNGNIRKYSVKPEDFGIKSKNISQGDITVNSIEQGCDIMMSLLKGEKGIKREIVLLNSAAGFVVNNMAKDFKSGIRIAEESIDSGKALKKLEQLIDLSKS